MDMAWFKGVVDLGVTALLFVIGAYLIVRPPQWVLDLVRSHVELAQGVTAISAVLQELPRRDEMRWEDVRIGQELILRMLKDLQDKVEGETRAADQR